MPAAAQVVTIDYEPTPKQQMFHRSKADRLLYGGAAGGGKSRACVMDALFRCLRHPGTHAYLFRRSYPELLDSLIKEAQECIPRELGEYKTSTHDLELLNGSVLHFRHCLREKDRFLYNGAEIDWLYIDELTTFSKRIVDHLLTRLRTKKTSGIKPIVRYTSNPGGIGHGWVKEMFIDSAKPFEIHTERIYSPQLKKFRDIKMQYIPAYVTDNPHITDDYLYELESKPKALRDALLYGKWDAFEGQVFIEFVNDPAHYIDRMETHVIEPFQIPKYWPRYRSFDFGYSKPFSVGWWAVDEFGRMYRYREWYGCVKNERNVGIKLSPKEIAHGILELEAEERNQGITVYGVCDPSLDDRSRGPSIMDAMAEEGVYFVLGDNARMAGKMQFHERLRMRHGRPMMQVFNTCKDFIKIIPELPYDENRTEDVDTDSEDHIFDECKYQFMQFPLVAVKPVERKRKPYNPLED